MIDRNQLLQTLLIAREDVSPVARMISALGKHCPGKNTVCVEGYGLWGSLSRLIAALAVEKLDRPLLFLTAHIPDAFTAQDDLESLSPTKPELFPAAEAHETDLDPASEIASERLRICRLLSREELDRKHIIVAPVQALMQPVPSPDFLEQQSLLLKVGLQITPRSLIQWLTEQSLERTDRVDVTGEFAARGGIVDIFPPGRDIPLRIEFFDNEIESIRLFDLDTQRSVDTLKEITITGCRKFGSTDESSTLFSFLERDTIIVFEEMLEVIEVGRIYLERHNDPRGLFSLEAIIKQAVAFDRLYLNHFDSGNGDTRLNLNSQSVQRFENQGRAALEELLNLSRQRHILFFCEKDAQRQRVREILQENIPAATSAAQPHKPDKLQIVIGYIHQGFDLPDEKLLVISHHEVFGRHYPRRRIRRIQATQAIDSFADLEINDLVVHVNHGIGIFRGMKTLKKNGRQQEYLSIEYADQAVIHVPATAIELVHKYVGAHLARPKLSKLGGKTWHRQKQKVSLAVEDMAAELIELQAQREAAPGITYPPDTDWQREFEASFPYEDTTDQVIINTEIKQDMQRSRPMDRLLCGDVGYGKTELAIRAAFKAAEFGKQTVLLVPTTVLAQQHYRTFCERMADFPFIIEVLSRFQTAGQARDILQRTAHGQVDILIGTHRILSPDVHFKDLGLVIIDEEQRFGVAHKERLKKMRQTVDILTMTATPIPRTLHMSLLGLRDISSLTSPPMDRRSIVTEVCPFDKQRIRSIILRELNRDGQVYFLHNRVYNIMTMADQIRRLVPEARISVAHGQMPKHELEARMLDFIGHKTDILVCTTIIESGLDIPNVNTIIINDADRFGLAELHQLRGRVGRYKQRAYAYMLLPTNRTINPTAAKRLKAIEEYTQLGSGFRIALRDLEIRGAGNILGIEQSGHIDAVGYEMYCQLLAAAVRRHKKQPQPPKSFTQLDLDVSSHIPRSYIASERQRLEVYRRLATCRRDEDIQQLQKDLDDLYGKPPQSVQILLQLAEIRMLASQWSIRSIIQKPPDLIFHLDENTQVQQLFANAPGSIRVPDTRTIYLRLRSNYFDSPQTILAVLRRMFATTSRQS